MKGKAGSKRRFKLNTPTEDRAIRSSIKSDRDTRELTERDFAQMHHFTDVIKQRGRPKSAVRKEPVTLRLDPEIVEFFRGGGRGWQTRMNKALAEYVSKSRRGRAAGPN